MPEWRKGRMQRSALKHVTGVLQRPAGAATWQGGAAEGGDGAGAAHTDEKKRRKSQEGGGAVGGTERGALAGACGGMIGLCRSEAGQRSCAWGREEACMRGRPAKSF
jgi:hypothetical protein